MKGVTKIEIAIVILIIVIMAALIVSAVNQANNNNVYKKNETGSNLYVEKLDGHEYVYVLNYSAGGIMHKVNCKCMEEKQDDAR